MWGCSAEYCVTAVTTLGSAVTAVKRHLDVLCNGCVWWCAANTEKHMIVSSVCVFCVSSWLELIQLLYIALFSCLLACSLACLLVCLCVLMLILQV